MLFTIVLCDSAQRVWRIYDTWQIQSYTCISASKLSVSGLLFMRVAISIYLEEIRVLPYINNEHSAGDRAQAGDQN